MLIPPFRALADPRRPASRGRSHTSSHRFVKALSSASNTNAPTISGDALEAEEFARSIRTTNVITLS
jgi:hypothetical protein